MALICPSFYRSQPDHINTLHSYIPLIRKIHRTKYIFDLQTASKENFGRVLAIFACNLYPWVDFALLCFIYSPQMEDQNILLTITPSLPSLLAISGECVMWIQSSMGHNLIHFPSPTVDPKWYYLFYLTLE